MNVSVGLLLLLAVIVSVLLYHFELLPSNLQLEARLSKRAKYVVVYGTAAVVFFAGLLVSILFS